MSILQVNDVRKILGAQEVLRGASLRVEADERVGVVGRNGGGKTTLLRIIEGEETADAGGVVIARGVRVGYVAQRPDFGPGVTVRAYVEGGLDEVHRVERELEQTAHDMAEADGDELDRLMRRHGELTTRMEHLGGWESERRVETVLGGIGLPRALWDREARTLSGGEASRTALARELVSVPDLLLLDEPTNHLDLAGIEWLESYLLEIKSAVLMVSHDRRMLDRMATAIAEVERGVVTRYPGNYSAYVRLKQERYQAELRAWEQQQDFIRKEEGFIKKHMGSQRTGEAKGRRKRLQGLARLPQPFLDVRKPLIAPPRAERGGEEVVRCEGLSLGYDGQALLADVDVRVGRGERIGIVGPNGAGKTTLLRALAGRAKPLAGEVIQGHKAVCAFYDQTTSGLDEDSTPFVEIRRVGPKLNDVEVRSHLALFLFRGDDVDLPVRGLSGGERARLVLAKLALTKPSWMALDEPTNHLDLASRTALEEMLGHFDGALLCVSHDRAFLDGLCNRIIEVEGGRVTEYRGNYSEYRAAVLAAETERAAAAETKRRAEAERAKAAERKQAARQAKPSGGRPRNPYKFEQLEKAIMALEEEREGLLASLATEEVYRDPEATREAQFRMAEVERELEEKNLEWERMI
jgi:ATP-binding cassette subfamily F protein 3